MTNEQLYLLMRSMLSELNSTIEQVRELMPEDAPKVEYTNLLRQVVDSEFAAIEPLNALWQTWNDRTELALGKQEDKARND